MSVNVNPKSDLEQIVEHIEELANVPVDPTTPNYLDEKSLETRLAYALEELSGVAHPDAFTSGLSTLDRINVAVNAYDGGGGASEFNVAHLQMVRTAGTGIVYAFCPILNDTTNRLEFKTIKITTVATEITCLFSNKFTFPTFINIMASATTLSDASSRDGNTLHFGNFWNNPNGTSRYYSITLSPPTTSGSIENDLITLTVG